MAISDYIRGKPVIRSQRLRLRTMCAEDVPALREWMADPAIYTYWGKCPGRTDRQPELLFKAPERQTKSLHLGMEELGKRCLIRRQPARCNGDLVKSTIFQGQFRRRRNRVIEINDPPLRQLPLANLLTYR